LFAAFLFSTAWAATAGDVSTKNCLPNSIFHSTTPACHPLHDAVKADHVVLVRLRLAEGADVNEVDVFGTPLHYAAARNSADIAKLLIDAGADLEAEAAGIFQRRAHPLHTAARANAVQVAKLVISGGAQVNARDADDVTPLLVAARNGSAEMVDLLLKSGADPVAEDSYYGTPIHAAAQQCRLSVVKLLVAKGVNVNIRNSHNGMTPLDGAICKDCVDVAEYLLEHGANPNRAENDDKTPLQLSGSFKGVCW
jgi:ankyrin repeat protein